MNLQQQILSYLIDDALKKLKKSYRLTEDFLQLKDARRNNSPKTLLSWHELFVRCHVLYGELGGVITRDHWQSPSFGGAVLSEVGDEQGEIIANLSDYKRDYHHIGAAYERAFARTFRLPNVYITNSGMSALTVALLMVRQRLPETYCIAVGEHSYFENKEIIYMMFPKKHIVLFDELHPDSLRSICPNAIFFDTVANDPDMTIADVSDILTVAGSIGCHVDVVVDTTCTSVLHVHIPWSIKIRKNISVIGFESLNKYHQFGLDRVTGGVLWGYGIEGDTIYRTRDHAGVNISESSAATLPTPNRKLFTLYLQRFEQNARYIMNEVKSFPNIQVRGYRFVSVSLANASWRVYPKLMNTIFREAKKQGVPLIAGSTFGTPVTRIYTFSPRSTFERPFLRIVPGLETKEQIQQVADVIRTAMLQSGLIGKRG